MSQSQSQNQSQSLKRRCLSEYLSACEDQVGYPPDPETQEEWEAFNSRFPDEAWRFHPTERNMELIETPRTIRRAAQVRLLYSLKHDAEFRRELQEALGIEEGS